MLRLITMQRMALQVVLCVMAVYGMDEQLSNESLYQSAVGVSATSNRAIASDTNQSLLISVMLNDEAHIDKNMVMMYRPRQDLTIERVEMMHPKYLNPVDGVTHFKLVHAELVSDYCRSWGQLRKDSKIPSMVHLDSCNKDDQLCILRNKNKELQDCCMPESNYDGKTNCQYRYKTHNVYYLYDEYECIIAILVYEHEIEKKNGVYPFLDTRSYRIIDLFTITHDPSTQKEYLNGLDSKGRCLFSQELKNDFFENGWRDKGAVIMVKSSFTALLLSEYHLTTWKLVVNDRRSNFNVLAATTAVTTASGAKNWWDYYTGGK